MKELWHRITLAAHVLRGRPLVYRAKLHGIQLSSASNNLVVYGNTVTPSLPDEIPVGELRTTP